MAVLIGIILSGLAMYQGGRSPVVVDYDVYLADLPVNMAGKTIIAP